MLSTLALAPNMLQELFTGGWVVYSQLSSLAHFILSPLSEAAKALYRIVLFSGNHGSNLKVVTELGGQMPFQKVSNICSLMVHSGEHLVWCFGYLQASSSQVASLVL